MLARTKVLAATILSAAMISGMASPAKAGSAAAAASGGWGGGAAAAASGGWGGGSAAAAASGGRWGGSAAAAASGGRWGGSAAAAASGGGSAAAAASGGRWGGSAAAAASGGRFGGSAAAAASGGRFGGSAAAAASGGRFGGSAAAAASGGRFGGSAAAAASGGRFGGSAAAAASGGRFGGSAAAAASGGRFGGSAAAAASGGSAAAAASSGGGGYWTFGRRATTDEPGDPGQRRDCLDDSNHISTAANTTELRKKTMNSLLNHGLSSLLGITLLGLSIPATQAQVFSTNGRSGVYVQGNGQGMAGTFDDKGFHGISVGPDGQVRRIEGNQASPFSMGQPSGISIHSGNGAGAFAAAGRMPATSGGFDPFAFVFGNSSPMSAAGVGAVAGPQPNRMLAAAKRAFLQRRYEETVRMTEELAHRGVESIDAVQLRGLARFALQDYEAAAADATTVLASEAAWDWPTLRTTYSDRRNLRPAVAGFAGRHGPADGDRQHAFSAGLPLPDAGSYQRRSRPPDPNTAAATGKSLGPATAGFAAAVGDRSLRSGRAGLGLRTQAAFPVGNAAFFVFLRFLCNSSAVDAYSLVRRQELKSNTLPTWSK